ncbi:MAG: hypothetical protein ACI81T_002205 [Bacteroidia bacterium]|jgi:hypothetical protein
MNNQLLYVEGGDDINFVEELLRRRKIEKQFGIERSGGLQNLKKTLPVLIETASYETIGVIVDADENIKSRWEEIREILVGNGYENVPQKLTPKGLILEDMDLPKVGIWIMPNNQVEGILEDFVSYLVDENDELFPIAQKAVGDLLKNGKARFNQNNKAKATIHTWLAWQKRPELSLSMAVSHQHLKNYILDDKKASDFVNWLQKLFKK